MDDQELIAARAEIERLREAIRRLAEQDATLSVQGGNVIVQMDATLTDAEREAVEAAIAYMAPVGNYDSRVQDTLRSLLERCAPDSDRPQPITPLSYAGKSAIAGQGNT